MKKLFILLAVIAASNTLLAQQRPQQIQNAIKISPIETATIMGMDTLNAVAVNVGSIINVTDTIPVYVKYYFANNGNGIEIHPSCLPVIIKLPLDVYMNITAGKPRLTAIVNDVLLKLGFTKITQ